MTAFVTPTEPGGPVVEMASLLTALRDTRALMPPLDLETDAQAEAVAVLWGLAAGGAGTVRQRAAGALCRLGVAPDAPVPCDQPGDIVGQCIALGLDCGRCEFNPANRDDRAAGVALWGRVNRCALDSLPAARSAVHPPALIGQNHMSGLVRREGAAFRLGMAIASRIPLVRSHAPGR